MNNMRRILTLVLSIFVTVSLFGQEVDNKKKIDKMLELGYFKIDITEIKPMGRPSKTTRFEFDITVKDHMLTTELPYFGKYDTTPMPGQQIRVEMDNQKVDLQVKYNEKKKRHDVRFKAKDDNDHQTVDFYIQIYENGSSTVRLSFVNRDPITFEGDFQFVEQQQ